MRLTGFKLDFKHEFGLAFGDFAEVYDPKSADTSNDVTMPRTEPCIALYPSANKKGSWIFFNLNTKAYVCRTQWTKLPTNKLVIAAMNELAGVSGIKVVDLELPNQQDEATMPEQAGPSLHTLNPEQLPLEMTKQEAAIEFEEGLEMPDLVDQEADDDSVSESSDSDDEVEDAMSESDPDDN